jgi:hypothetical protein
LTYPYPSFSFNHLLILNDILQMDLLGIFLINLNALDRVFQNPNAFDLSLNHIP